ncbi:hypothetical protein J7I84_07045 [Arthrobacter sp. ISL-85]|uniref:hypothetical protein n=1 Tax=Arthrobacter sp. ISL-85 TaxID=2819115 RepID=UPI001BE4E2B3|nr:hypothetical protein [Arthrobacter sp. ISL-85]MBT2566257.1 hypothetical protein [Arthrobacter sp. ISL-85]
MESGPETGPAQIVPRTGEVESLAVRVQASSTRPADWGRALAQAVSLLIDQVTALTGSDPTRAPEGLDLSLHVTALPAGEEITVTWNG